MINPVFNPIRGWFSACSNPGFPFRVSPKRSLGLFTLNTLRDSLSRCGLANLKVIVAIEPKLYSLLSSLESRISNLEPQTLNSFTSQRLRRIHHRCTNALIADRDQCNKEGNSSSEQVYVHTDVSAIGVSLYPSVHTIPRNGGAKQKCNEHQFTIFPRQKEHNVVYTCSERFAYPYFFRSLFGCKGSERK